VEEGIEKIRQDDYQNQRWDEEDVANSGPRWAGETAIEER
jgi:hypothetical protein